MENGKLHIKILKCFGLKNFIILHCHSRLSGEAGLPAGQAGLPAGRQITF